MKELIKFELRHRKIAILIFIVVNVISGFYLFQQNKVVNTSKLIITNAENSDMDSKDIGDREFKDNINMSIINDDSQLYLESMIGLDNYYLKINAYSGLETKEYYQNRIEFNQYLLDNDIKSLNQIMSSYNKLEEINGVSAINQVLDKIIPILMPFSILIIAYQVFFLNTSTYNYIMTLPYTKKKILTAKWLTVFITNALILLFTVTISFVLGTLIGGSGDFNYPIVTNYLNINSANQTFISFYFYLPLVLIFELVRVAIYTTLGMFLANFTKNRWITLLTTIIFSLIPIVYILNLDYTYYSNLIPFFFDSGHAIVTYNFSLINKIGYILVMITTIYFSIKISTDLFEKREK